MERIVVKNRSRMFVIKLIYEWMGGVNESQQKTRSR